MTALFACFLVVVLSRPEIDLKESFSEVNSSWLHFPERCIILMVTFAIALARVS